MYGGFPVRDEVREHMFDNWSERQLQKLADYEEYTVPELKERLLEFAVFHNFSSLDSFLKPLDRPDFQFDGALSGLMDHDSDDSESVFHNSDASLLSKSWTQYDPPKPATELITPGWSRRSRYPMPFGRTPHQFINIDAGPVVRTSNSELSLEFELVPDFLPLAYNPERRVLHLTGAGFANASGGAEIDSLVIFIKGVVYGDHEAGSAVFFHPKSQWNTVTIFDDTVSPPKESATLEALWLALHMISSTAAMDENLRKVRILCAGDEIENALEKHRLGKLIQPASRQPLSEINKFWENITNGVNGERRVDLRLWKVSEETMQPITDEANCYMYKMNGRDWVKENGKGQDRLKNHPKDSSPENLDSPKSSYNLASYLALAADDKATLMSSLEQHSIHAPREVVNMGPQAVSRWMAEVKARVHQDILHAILAPEIYRNIGKQPSTYEEARDAADWFRSYEKALEIMVDREQAHLNLDAWCQSQAKIWDRDYEQDYDPDQEIIQNDDVGETESELVKQVLEMDWE